jgi:hypothetical protein
VALHLDSFNTPSWRGAQLKHRDICRVNAQIFETASECYVYIPVVIVRFIAQNVNIFGESKNRIKSKKF